MLAHLLAEALGEERRQVIVDPLAARVFDSLHDRFRTALCVLLQDGRDLLEPPVRSALRVANADLGLLVCAPNLQWQDCRRCEGERSLGAEGLRSLARQ